MRQPRAKIGQVRDRIYRVWRAGVGLGLLLLLSGCASNLSYHWRWEVISPWDPQGKANFLYLVAGFPVTLEITALSIVFGILFGLVIAFLRLSRFTIKIGRIELKVYLLFHLLIRVYQEVLRNVPLFTLMLWMYFAAPIITPIETDPYLAVVLTLSITAAAFMSEVFRAGIESIDRGHIEAARSLGMSGWQTMRRIVLPQAIRRVLPPITSEFVIIVKASSIASFVGVAELTRRAFQIIAGPLTQTRQPEIYAFLTLEYLIILVTLSRFSQWLEKKTAIP
ncbi:MAG: amino acid ABC transporter permease [Nitrospinota bacterium]|nr:MAG: amino acid ABC transporter permease [Nitrospinota bacterium]